MLIAVWGVLLFMLSVAGLVAGLLLWFTRNGNRWSRLLIWDTVYMSLTCMGCSWLLEFPGGLDYRVVTVCLLISLGGAGGVVTTISLLLVNLSESRKKE